MNETNKALTGQEFDLGKKLIEQRHRQRATVRLWTAVKNDDVHAVAKELDQGANLHATRQFGESDLLELAIKKCEPKMLQLLIERGVKLDRPVVSACGPVLPVQVAVECGNLEAVKILLQNGARDELVIADQTFSTLAWAAREGKEELAAMRLACGADPDEKDACGWTPLMFAARFGHLPVVEALLQHNASTDIMTPAGNTAADLASLDGLDAIVEAIRAHEQQQASSSMIPSEAGVEA